MFVNTRKYRARRFADKAMYNFFAWYFHAWNFPPRLNPHGKIEGVVSVTWFAQTLIRFLDSVVSIHNAIKSHVFSFYLAFGNYMKYNCRTSTPPVLALKLLIKRAHSVSVCITVSLRWLQWCISNLKTRQFD